MVAVQVVVVRVVPLDTEVVLVGLEVVAGYHLHPGVVHVA